MQIVSMGDNLHEISKLIFYKKKQKKTKQKKTKKKKKKTKHISISRLLKILQSVKGLCGAPNKRFYDTELA